MGYFVAVTLVKRRRTDTLYSLEQLAVIIEGIWTVRPVAEVSYEGKLGKRARSAGSWAMGKRI
jgi:hypothetical protein